MQSFANFSEALAMTFGDSDVASQAERQLTNLRQTTSVSSFYNEFKRLATLLKWNDPAQKHLFYVGLKSNIKDELAKSKRPDTFQDLAELSISIDNRIYERIIEKKREITTNYGRPIYDNTVVPMEIDATSAKPIRKK